MKSEVECIGRIAEFDDQEHLALNVAGKGWKIKKKEESIILIPTKKKTCLTYIDIYTKHFKVSKETALASLEKLLEEFEISDYEKLLAGLFAKECKKAKEIEVLPAEVDISLEEALEIDKNQIYPETVPYDPFSNVDSFYFKERN